MAVGKLRHVDFSHSISESLRRLQDDFRRDELAYLALTVKIEQPIRDRLAFLLHEQLAPDGVVVAREWKNIDIAILIDGKPRALIELKAAYTFDIIKGGAAHECFDQIVSDVRKCFSRGYEGVEVFTLLLATHPHQLPHASYECAVAYYPYVRGYIRRQPDASTAYELSDKQVRTILETHPARTKGRLFGGSAFGVEVSVSYWLFGPYGHVV